MIRNTGLNDKIYMGMDLHTGSAPITTLAG